MHPLDMVLYFVAGIAGIFITAWIFSVVFQINRSIKLQRIQSGLLAEIALKAGSDKEDPRQSINIIAMKAFITGILIFSTLMSYCQDSLLTFSEVVQVPEATKDQLFLKARQWFNTSFKNSKNVLQIVDKESGELAGKGNTAVKVVYHMLGADHSQNWDCNFMVNIWVKEGKYKYEFTSISVNDSGENERYRLLTTASKANYKISYASQKMTDKVWASMKKGAIEEFTSAATSLKAAMAAKVDKANF